MLWVAGQEICEKGWELREPSKSDKDALRDSEAEPLQHNIPHSDRTSALSSQHRLPSLCLLLSCQRLPSQDYLLLEGCVLCLKLWGHIQWLLHSQDYQECQDSESKTNSQANLVFLLPPTLGDPHQGIYTPSIPLPMLGILYTSLCKVPKVSAETI